MTLRKGVLFHNDKELTSADVVASLKRYGEITARGKGFFTELEAMDAPDKYTVTMSFKQPRSGVLPIFLSRREALIMPAELAQKFGKDKATEFVGTGPYKFVEWQPDRMVRLQRFDKYVAREDAADGPSGKKVAYLDEIQFIPVPEESVRADGVGTGEYHYGDSLAPDSYARVKGVRERRGRHQQAVLLGCRLLQQEGRRLLEREAAPGGPGGRQGRADRGSGVRRAGVLPARSEPGGARDALVLGRRQGRLEHGRPGEGEGALEGGRLRRHADPLALHQGVLLQLQRRRGLQAAARGDRLQDRPSDHGLGHADQAALRPEGVRRLHHRDRRVRPPDPAQRLRRRLARLVDAAGEERGRLAR